MIIVDSLLIGGLRFVLDKLIAAADAELSDDSALRETLLEAQVRRELGELSEEDYLTLEADLLQRIQEVQGGARGPIQAASGYEIAGVEATFTGDEHSKDHD
jgi:Gas vesicle protein G